MTLLSNLTPLSVSEEIFFAEFDKRRLEDHVTQALHGADDGELYLEYVQSESLIWDDSRLKSANFETKKGLSLRALCGESCGLACGSVLDEGSIVRAKETVQGVTRGHSGIVYLPENRSWDRSIYGLGNPLERVSFADKVGLLGEMDHYARGLESCVRQVNIGLSGAWKVVHIIRPEGSHCADVRPLVRMFVEITVERGGRQESGQHGVGGRVDYGVYLETGAWKRQIEEALRQALVKVEAVPAPAGEMTVVLGKGWPGILLHEAVGHGLEGDFNRKKTSAFSGLMGQRVAVPGVTVVDDGTLAERRGSLIMDDEGTPSQRTVLIEDGILVGYMQDRHNARLMKMSPTGNGRRQSFAHPPLPRMTNTFMLSGDQEPQEIWSSVDQGVYAVNFSGGQVDITSGKFVFSASEAYRIEKGRLTAPLKGAMIIGNGPEALTRIDRIGNDSCLDSGIGTCGKDGQWVPVGVGLPTLSIKGLTVGGTL